MTTLYQFIPDTREKECRKQIARLRSIMFTLTEKEQEQAGQKIEQLKAECAANWDARANDFHGKRLASMGY